MHRRTFLSGIAAGSVLAGLTKAEETNTGSDTAVIWVFCRGGMSGFESFTPNLRSDIPEQYQSVTGQVHDPTTGIVLGGNFEKTIKLADKFSVVRNFGHNDSSHSQATDQLFSGHLNTSRIVGATTQYPSHGAITANYFGNNNPDGIPTFVALSKSNSDKPVWIGSKYGPFDPSNKDNLIPKSEETRFRQRMKMIEIINKKYDGGQLEEGWTEYQKQAFGTIFGEAKNAFDINKVPQKVRDRYGSAFGQQLLMALRLATFGTRWITVQTTNSWDFHTNIKDNTEKWTPELDAGIANLIQDIYDLGLNKKIMVVVTTEFSRTKININAGRDHHSKLTPLLISGGDYEHGRTIGETDKYSYDVANFQIEPIHLQGLMMDHLKIDKQNTVTDTSGRPRVVYDLNGKQDIKIL